MEDIRKLNKGLCNLVLLSFLCYFVVFPFYHHHELPTDTKSIDEIHNCNLCKYKAFSGEVLTESKKTSITIDQIEISLVATVSFTTCLLANSNFIRGPPELLI